MVQLVKEITSVYTFVHPTVPQTELSTFSHRTDSTK